MHSDHCKWALFYNALQKFYWNNIAACLVESNIDSLIKSDSEMLSSKRQDALGIQQPICFSHFLIFE